LKQVSQAIIEAIEHAKMGKGKKSRLEELQEELKRLKDALVEKDETIAKLEGIARTLGYIKVEVPSPSLPEVQNISKAIVHSVEGGVAAGRGESARGSSPPVTVQAPVSPDPVHERQFSGAVIDIEGAVGASAELPPAVRRHIDRVVSRVAKQGILHRRVLAFVIGHAPISHSVDQIAAWTNCARGVIEEDPPREFLDMGLLLRERRTDGLHYRSNLKGFVTREFGVYQPDIGGGELHRITQCLRARLAAIEVSEIAV
jgi:hypothetical protein